MKNASRSLQYYNLDVIISVECREIILDMQFGDKSELFGKEKDNSFKGSIGNIYELFDGQELYSSMEEKAAYLPYYQES